MSKKYFVSVILSCALCAVARADTSGCPAGYVGIVHCMSNEIMAPSSGLCEPGYQLKDVPYDVIPANGASVGNGIPVCDGYWTGTTCNQPSVNCPSNQRGVYYNHVAMAPMLGQCEPGFGLRDVSSGIVITNASSFGSGMTMTHSTYTEDGDCPTNYKDMGITTEILTDTTNGSCQKNYKTTTSMSHCDRNPGNVCLNSPSPQITINWYDGINENPTVSTCFIEDKVVLPPTPTRPGYVFGGWRVRQ